MKFVSQLIVLIIPVIVSAQLADFDLKNIEQDKFKETVEPFIKSVSISSINHFEDQFNSNKRLQLGIAYSHGINLSGVDKSSELFGGYPNIGGGLMISENLKLKGNFAVFNSGDNIVQSFAYGVGINIATNEKNSWRMSLMVSELNGPTDIEIKAMDGVINYGFRIKNMPAFIGLGTNSYKSKILLEGNEIPGTIKGNTLYFSLGLQLVKGNFTTTPIIKLSSKAMVFGLEFSGVII